MLTVATVKRSIDEKLPESAAGSLLQQWLAMQLFLLGCSSLVPLE